MRNPKAYATAAVAAVCLSLAGALIFISVTTVDLTRDASNLIVMLSGAAFSFGAGLIAQLAMWMARESWRDVRVAQETMLPTARFDEGRLQLTFERVQDVEFVEVPQRNEPWEPAATNLLLEDRSLALAKVRIDLEREVRRIVLELRLLQAKQFRDVGRMVDLLKAHEVLPAPIIFAIRDILPVCNAAIHGHDVEMEVALQTVQIADEVIKRLRGVRGATTTPAQVSEGE